jgi:hypothetical protein
VVYARYFLMTLAFSLTKRCFITISLAFRRGWACTLEDFYFLMVVDAHYSGMAGYGNGKVIHCGVINDLSFTFCLPLSCDASFS